MCIWPSNVILPEVPNSAEQLLLHVPCRSAGAWGIAHIGRLPVARRVATHLVKLWHHIRISTFRNKQMPSIAYNLIFSPSKQPLVSKVLARLPDCLLSPSYDWPQHGAMGIGYRVKPIRQ